MFNCLLSNLLHPPILFFLLGMLAVCFKSDLEIPGQIAKFLSLYLLFHIGFEGGLKLFHSGFSNEILFVLGICALVSFLTPWILYQVLKIKLNVYDAGAIAASYGSISAVNFIISATFLETHNIPYNGYMVAAMALMESPAVISGLMLIGFNKKNENISFNKVLHESFLNGSVFLLLGSLLIGLVCGNVGELELKPFVSDVFKGMLCFYMLDMGIVAGQKISGLKQNFWFLSCFALLYAPIAAALGIAIAKLIGLSIGDALLFTTLVSSASFIAVPAAMRLSVPQANMGIVIPMALGITFVFNIVFGVPLYLPVIQYFWQY